MKLVTAIIQPSKLDTVRDALARMGVTGLTLTEVKGFGRQKGHAEVYRGSEYSVDFVSKVKLEIAVADDQAASVVDGIIEAAHTGKIGDGKVFVSSVDEATRIRTKETGEDAL